MTDHPFLPGPLDVERCFTCGEKHEEKQMSDTRLPPEAMELALNSASYYEGLPLDPTEWEGVVVCSYALLARAFLQLAKEARSRVEA